MTLLSGIKQIVLQCQHQILSAHPKKQLYKKTTIFQNSRLHQCVEILFLLDLKNVRECKPEYGVAVHIIYNRYCVDTEIISHPLVSAGIQEKSARCPIS
jgi:hypothetical protein